MKRCRCCRERFPLEFYPPARFHVDGTPIRRASCDACRRGCTATARRERQRVNSRTWNQRHPDRHYAEVKAYRSHLRSQVEAVRLARARATCDNGRVGISDASANRMWPVLSVADTSREDVPRLEVSAP